MIINWEPQSAVSGDRNLAMSEPLSEWPRAHLKPGGENGRSTLPLMPPYGLGLTP